MPAANFAVTYRGIDMMTKQQIEAWLLDKVEQQIIKTRIALEMTIEHLDNRDWKGASEQHRQVDYWLSRIKNTQRLLEELNDVT